MVADPFTIAGAFGLVAGLTGFVASTIEKSAGQIDTVRNAHSRLRAHQGALKCCQQRLEAWARQWYDHDEIIEEDLSFLWGVKGFHEIERQKANILAEQDSLLKFLYGRRWFEVNSEEATSHWENILRGQEDALRRNNAAPDAPSDSRSRDLYIRISTALWNNSLLAASIERLRRLLEDLEAISRLRFHEAQKSIDHHKQPSTEEIGGIIRQHHRMQRLVQGLSVAYQDLRRSAGSCELLLTSFDKTEMCQLGTQDQLVITFLSVRINDHDT
jgi:hypothetical protein